MMEKNHGKGGKKMTNGNGKNSENLLSKEQEAENTKYKNALKKAVNAEKAPEELKSGIRKMIRER
jgi:hypothetical protein